MSYLEQKQFYYLYDTISTAYTYGRIGSPSGHPIQGKYGVETDGSSTTVTATDGTPFDPVLVGDIIVFETRPDTKAIRKVATKTSGSSIVVDSAITLAGGNSWFFLPFKNGTTVDDGWHNVAHWSAITLHVRVVTLNSTSIDILPEGTGGGLSGPVALAAATNVAAIGTVAINVDKVTPFLRVGLKANTEVAGDEITVWAVGEMLQR